MMKLSRPTAPLSLATNYKLWGKELKRKWDRNPKAKFHWHGAYEEIISQLHLMTSNHCSYCDIQPLKQSGATIDHFRPKRKFPLLAFAWNNLFYCCLNCQKKGDSFDRQFRPLKPDALDYHFGFYFELEETVEEVFVRPNSERSGGIQQKAMTTIKDFGLNDFGRPEARKIVLEDYREDLRLGKCKPIEQYPYRFMLT